MSIVDQLRNEAIQIFYEKYSAGNFSTSYSYPDLENAFVHSYVAAKLTYDYGADITLKLGYLKEIATKSIEIKNFGSRQNAFLDTNKDLWNNDAGVNYALQGISEGKDINIVADRIFESIMSQDPDFIIDYKNDPRRWDPSANENNLWEKLYPKMLEGQLLTSIPQSYLNTVLGCTIASPGVNPVFSASITGIFTAAEGAKQVSYSDPLILDLDGDGIETTTVENGVYFDHAVDGFKELSAWVGEDDGILVLDKNNNGSIDDGSEISKGKIAA